MFSFPIVLVLIIIVIIKNNPDEQIIYHLFFTYTLRKVLLLLNFYDFNLNSKANV